MSAKKGSGRERCQYRGGLPRPDRIAGEQPALSRGPASGRRTVRPRTRPEPGDGGDVYHKDGVFLLDETTVPNTDAYQNGDIVQTLHSIEVLTSAELRLRFDSGFFRPPTRGRSDRDRSERERHHPAQAADDGLRTAPDHLCDRVRTDSWNLAWVARPSTTRPTWARITRWVHAGDGLLGPGQVHLHSP